MIKDDPDYWCTRRELRYYQEALRLCRKYSMGACNVLEVGARNTTFLEWLDWIPRKVAIDRDLQPIVANAINIQADFMEWETAETFDLGVCLQVLEHLEDVAPFAQKLRRSCRTLVVSVPHLWRKGTCKGHRQDPVDLAKLHGWFRGELTEYVIVRDGRLERLVGVFASAPLPR